MIYDTRVLTCGVITKNLTVCAKQFTAEAQFCVILEYLVRPEKCHISKPRASEANCNPCAVARAVGLAKLGHDHLQS